MRDSKEGSLFSPVHSPGPRDDLVSKLGVLWEVSEKEAHLGRGDVGWLGLLISFQSEGQTEGELGAS